MNTRKIIIRGSDYWICRFNLLH